MIKTQVLVKRKPGLSRDVFERYWLDKHMPIVSGIPGIQRQTLSIVRSDLQRADTPWDGLANAWWESREALEQARGHDAFQAMLEDEAHFVDLSARKPLVVQEINPVAPNQPPRPKPEIIKIVNPLYMRSDLTYEDFSAYWSGPHAAINSELPHMKSYIQNHIHPDFRQNERACDGIAESWFNSWEEILEITQSEAFTRLQEDEANLIADNSLLPMVCREIEAIFRA